VARRELSGHRPAPVSHRTAVVDFFRSDPTQLLAVLDELAAAGDGWVNLQAVEDDEEAPDAQPARAGLFSLVGGRGPRIPIGTWVPGERGGRRRDPDSIGIQHAAGPKALRRLVAAGVTPPDGASLLSDHPKRGLVLALADGTSPALVLAWLFAACEVLSSDPLPDTWVAIVHRR
jgi:hypothetical protein